MACREVLSKMYFVCVCCIWMLLLQHTATHCITLQHTATHCTALQHTATHATLCVCIASECCCCNIFCGITLCCIPFCCITFCCMLFCGMTTWLTKWDDHRAEYSVDYKKWLKSRDSRNRTSKSPHLLDNMTTQRWCIKLYVSFAKKPYKRDDILQKRPRFHSLQNMTTHGWHIIVWGGYDE